MWKGNRAPESARARLPCTLVLTPRMSIYVAAQARDSNKKESAGPRGRGTKHLGRAHTSGAGTSSSIARARVGRGAPAAPGPGPGPGRVDVM